MQKYKVEDPNILKYGTSFPITHNSSKSLDQIGQSSQMTLLKRKNCV